MLDCRLYFSDLRGNNGVVLINTVEYNKLKHSIKDYKRAVDVRKLQSMVGSPSYKHFQEILNSKELQNCPLTRDDVDAAKDIFGANLQVLKKRTTRKKSMQVRGSNLKIPLTVLERYRDVVLTGDVMFVNGI